MEGYSWNSSASDTLEIRKRGMRPRTTFTWYVEGRRVARKTARITLHDLDRRSGRTPRRNRE